MYQYRAMQAELNVPISTLSAMDKVDKQLLSTHHLSNKELYLPLGKVADTTL